MTVRRWMFATELISDLAQEGITLWSEDERLRYRAPSGMLTSTHRELLVDFKKEILDVLRDRPMPSMACTVRSFACNTFRAKCYVCHSKGEAVLIDPSFVSESERRAVLDYIENNKLSIKHVLLTHGHVDHFYGAAFYAREFDKSFLVHPDDVELLNTAEFQAKMISSKVETPPPPEGLLKEGETVSFGDVTWQVLHCPGHSPGSICFYDEASELLFSGDVLFRGAIGNMHMPGGSLSRLIESIEKQLLPLPESTIVYPGHGPPTTIGRERSSNAWFPKDCC